MAMVNRGRVHAGACRSRPARKVVVGLIGMVSPESSMLQTERRVAERKRLSGTMVQQVVLATVER